MATQNEPPSTPQQHQTLPRTLDLTSSAGIAAAAVALLGAGVAAPVALPALGIAAPLAWLAAQWGKKKTSPNPSAPAPEPTAASALAQASSVIEQRDAIVELLKTGREQGLSELEVIVESSIGGELAAGLPKALKVDVKLKAGRDSKVTLRAKYR